MPASQNAIRQKPAQTPKADGTTLLRVPAICIGLVLLTVLAFCPVIRCGFINFDDGGYVATNPLVQRGLSGPGIVWAFTSAPMELWHPLSFISFMIDVDLFGLTPAGFHAVNLAIHAASVVLLFMILWRMTSATLLGAMAAALFAVHPLRVESVAWIAERKDVLATFFGLAAVLVYVSFAKRGRVWRLAIVTALLVLSLLAKPMFVTLPVLLLLLDFWPLGRLKGVADLWPRLVEKIPLAVVCVLLALIALWMAPKKSPNAHSDAYVPSTNQRQENAVIAYLRYLEKMVRVDQLAIFYPIPPAPPIWKVIVAAAVLAGVWIAVIALSRSRPWLLVGWAWFFIALLPVIGFERNVGFHSMADRYSYLPSIGVIVAVIWSIPAGWMRDRRGRVAIGAGFVAVIVFCCIMTWRQIGFWHGSIAVFQHDIDVVGDNDFAEYSLGSAYWQERHDAADSIASFERALVLRPDVTAVHDNLGLVLASERRFPEAFAHFRAATIIDPTLAEPFANWGYAVALSGDMPGSIPLFRKAEQIDPMSVPARVNLAQIFTRMHRYDEAIDEYHALLTTAPDNPQFQEFLADVERRKQAAASQRLFR